MNNNLRALAGFIGAMIIVFYGIPLHWNEQAYRQTHLQDMADPAQFSATEKESINNEIDKEISRAGKVSTDQQQFSVIYQWAHERTMYESALRNYGTPEYFASAQETYISKKGNCEGIAALITAVLRMRGVGQAKIATSKVHAEPSLTSTSIPLPEPPTTNLRRLELLLEKLIAVPWLRLVYCSVWFYACCTVNNKKKLRYLKGVVTTLCLGFISLEVFTQGYVQHPACPTMTALDWATLICGANAIIVATLIWICYRISNMLNTKAWAHEISHA